MPEITMPPGKTTKCENCKTVLISAWGRQVNNLYLTADKQLLCEACK